MLDIVDRTLGVLLGTALGDAFGAPFEGASACSLDADLERRARLPRPWKYTDDTQMTLDVARWLADGGELEPKRLFAKFADAFDPVRGYGRGMRRAIEAFIGGTPWTECAFVTWPEGSAGNGSAARVSPIACRYRGDTAKLIAAATLSSRLTHAHPDAITGAVLQALAVGVALESTVDAFSPPEFLARLSAFGVGGWAPAKLDVLCALGESNASAAQVVAALGNGVRAEEAVPAALWAFVHAGPSFEPTILAAAGLGGDVDTICALSGALAGAICGRAGLPAHLLDNLAHERPGVDEIEDIGRSLVRDSTAQLGPATDKAAR